MIGEMIGRFHPLLVHLPIGVLILGFIMDLASRMKRWGHLQKSIPFVLQTAILFSFLAWFTGWIMPKEGSFDERLIGLHFWFAVGVTLASIMTYLLHQSKKYAGFYFPMYCLTMILLTVTGHYGGSLTHGEDYLTKSLYEEPAVVITDVNSLTAFSGIIQPIIKQKCVSCHNEGKKKGGLIMTSIEALKKGGDAGAIIKAGDISVSSMIQRIHLPLEDDGHMPPSGKKQLTDNELSLLEWWIAEGADFEKKVGALNQSEEISNILKTYEKNESSINTKGLEIISDDQLSKFAGQGILVLPLSAENPLVMASTARDSSLSAGKINKLKGIAENIVELDLSFTNLDDGMMSQLSRFKNLRKLKIQNTNVGSKGIKYLEKLKHLQYLNCYATKVDDEAFESFEKMKSLSELYLWQSKVNSKSVQAYAENHPLISVNHEIDNSIFGDAKLKPPIIIADKDIFDDTLTIALDMNFKNVNIYYTIDGSMPDSSSTLYTGPFVINKTAAVKAISSKDGWGTSDSEERVFTKVGHKVVSAQLQQAPNEKYKARGAKSLYDHIKGSTSFVDGKWLGYEGQHMTTVLDLGELRSVSNVVVSALEDTGSYIFFPKGIEVASSIDGQNYKASKALTIPIAEGPNPSSLKSFLLDFETQEARYIRVKVIGTLKNPSWHAAPGASNWIFVDEIMVN